MSRLEIPGRPLFDETGRFIPRRYGDDRGALRYDRLGLAVPVDFRAYVRHAANAAGMTMAEFVREAVEVRAAEILSKKAA